MRDREEPLDEPEPAAERLVQSALDGDRGIPPSRRAQAQRSARRPRAEPASAGRGRSAGHRRREAARRRSGRPSRSSRGTRPLRRSSRRSRPAACRPRSSPRPTTCPSAGPRPGSRPAVRRRDPEALLAGGRHRCRAGVILVFDRERVRLEVGDLVVVQSRRDTGRRPRSCRCRRRSASRWRSRRRC